jgi:hypothetical protein
MKSSENEFAAEDRETDPDRWCFALNPCATSNGRQALLVPLNWSLVIPARRRIPTGPWPLRREGLVAKSASRLPTSPCNLMAPYTVPKGPPSSRVARARKRIPSLSACSLRPRRPVAGPVPCAQPAFFKALALRLIDLTRSPLIVHSEA